MSAFGDHLEAAFLDAALRGVTFTSPGTTFLSLHTAVGASESSAAWQATELTTGGATNYDRASILTSQWSAPVASGAGMISTINADIAFPTAGSSWGLITHLALWDVVTPGTGNLYFYWTLPQARTINNGDVAQITSGNLSVTLS